MDINVDFGCACEKKTTARTFMCANHGPRHLYDDLESYVTGYGYCTIHRDYCDIRDLLPADLLVAGLPCHPYTKARQKSDPTSKRRGATCERHRQRRGPEAEHKHGSSLIEGDFDQLKCGSRVFPECRPFTPALWRHVCYTLHYAKTAANRFDSPLFLLSPGVFFMLMPLTR